MVNFNDSPATGAYNNYIENLGALASGSYVNYIENNNLNSVTSINFATLFPGAYQVVQTDLGLTYGGTTKASNGAGPIGTLSGTLTTVPVPILFKCTTGGVIGSGAVFSAYYDGGTVAVMTGITPNVDVPIALTGAGTGLSHSWGAGTAVLNDTWTATCSALADQSGNGKHNSQAATGKQPILTLGLNNKPGLQFDGVDDYLQNSVGTLLTAGLNYDIIIIGRYIGTHSGNCAIIGSSSGICGFIWNGPSPGTTMILYNNGSGPTLSLPVTSNTRISAKVVQSGTSKLQVGSSVATAATGSQTDNIRYVGCNVPALPQSCEIFAVIYTPPITSLSVLDSVLNSSQGYGVGSTQV